MLYLLFFDLQDAVPVIFFADFDVGLRFALFVFEGAVEEDDARVGDAPAHFRVRDVFVEHHAVEHFTVFYFSPWDLLDAGVAFNIDFFFPAADVVGDGPDGFKGQVAH